MTEHRRIPEVERLEGRDMPSVLGVPYVAPPVHLGAMHAGALPQVDVLTPAAPSVAGASPVTLDVAAPVAAGASSHPFAAVWQQSADAIFSSDPIATEWTQPHVATDSVTATAVAPAQPMPTADGVLRYAWRSVNRHNVGDREDAVQQVCLEWLLLAATVQTTYDDVRRIVGRVLNRAYRRLKKQQLAQELYDVPVNADPVDDAFRDMQLDRDLGMNDLTDREWQVLRLRRQGCSFAEIGRELGIRRQRARELVVAAVSSLRKRYCKVAVLA
jgi:DNA-directed RNA polymerase specialized sigma24 family protein